MFFWQDVDFGTLLPQIYNKKKRVTAQRLKSQSDTYTQWGATATHPPPLKSLIAVSCKWCISTNRNYSFLPALLRCESITSLFSVQLSAFNHARRSSHQTLMPRVFRLPTSAATKLISNGEWIFQRARGRFIQTAVWCLQGKQRRPPNRLKCFILLEAGSWQRCRSSSRKTCGQHLFLFCLETRLRQFVCLLLVLKRFFWNDDRYERLWIWRVWLKSSIHSFIQAALILFPYSEST